MSFFFGQTPSLTPDGARKKKELADAFAARIGSPRNLGEGLSAIGGALAARGLNKQAESAERSGRERASSVFSSLISGESPKPYGASTGAMSILGMKPITPEQEIGDEAMAAIGKPEAMSDVGFFNSLEQEHGLPAGYLARTAQIESGGNPNAQNPNSSAGGMFQFIDSTAQQYGLTDKTDPRASARAAARLAADNAAHLRGVLGREPTAAELYLAHQQGAGGAAKLLSNPSASAAGVVGTDAVSLNGGNAHMSAGEFANQWLGKFDGNAPRTTSQVDNSQLYAALADPWMDQAQKSAILAMIQQNQQANDPMRQLALEKAELELAQMRSPQPVSPNDRYKVVNNQLVDMMADGGPQSVDLGGQSLPQANFDDESKLRKEFTGLPATKAFSEQAQAFGRIEASAKDPSPAGDLALIFNYMKVLDPGSVVRESEFATAEQAAAWLQEMGNSGYKVPLPVARAIRKAETGERLSDEQRTDFVGRASQLYLSAEGQADDRYNDWKIRAEEYGMSPERTLPDFRYTPRGATPISLRPQPRPGSAVTPSEQPTSQWSGPSVDEIQQMDPQTLNAMLSAYDLKDIPDDVLQAIEERM